jgi:hypothetical protein
MKGGRAVSQWNLFTQKVYKEGKAKNSNYKFRDALKDASRRKAEMGSMNVSRKRSRKSARSAALTGGSRKSGRSAALAGGSRRNRSRSNQ